MIAEAKAEILRKAEMIGKARALVNETVEIHDSFFLIGNKRKITVTAQLIEFVGAKTRN